jgi:hypothetical protein
LRAGFLLPAIIRRESGPERTNHVSRTNRRHTRAIERRRRNKGPALLSVVADNELQQKATQIVKALFEAITQNHNATAAGLLLQLAETAEYADNPALFERVKSLAEQWAREPQVVMLDVNPVLNAPPKQHQLTEGDGDADTADPSQATDIDSDTADSTKANSSTVSGASETTAPAPSPQTVEAIYE